MQPSTDKQVARAGARVTRFMLNHIYGTSRKGGRQNVCCQNSFQIRAGKLHYCLRFKDESTILSLLSLSDDDVNVILSLFGKSELRILSTRTHIYILHHNTLHNPFLKHEHIQRTVCLNSQSTVDPTGPSLTLTPVERRSCVRCTTCMCT